ncbi:hypothetical protein PN462_05245 [Spirulina sp. CS-785/01]|uniref:hypothetical protein n=1 Tax=Spirulina sp. CS-785/01 TaxID=3021716 RepID=UPI00232D3EAC|nr:hypothetical protein [Spirulina sp. CS-785/01]MDB9312502.1 hypothetical protein [Spirulina sp. CS-785/01]
MRQFTTRLTTIASLQAISAVIMIPLSFLLAINEGVHFWLGGVRVEDDLGSESSYAKALVAFIIAIISLLAGLFSLFFSLQLFQTEQSWTQLGTLGVQGCILGAELAKVFVNLNPNFVILGFAVAIISLLLIRLRIDKAFVRKKATNLEQSPETANASSENAS